MAVRDLTEGDGFWTLRPVVDALCEANADLVQPRRRRMGRRSFPSREVVGAVVNGLRSVLFPWHFGASDVSGEGLSYYVGHTLDAALARLREQVHVGLLFECGDEDGSSSVASARAVEVTRAFASRLPRCGPRWARTIGCAGSFVWGPLIGPAR